MMEISGPLLKILITLILLLLFHLIQLSIIYWIGYSAVSLFLSWTVADSYIRRSRSASETQKVTSKSKAVFITGCDSGFGHRTAKRLATELGFTVFAACLDVNSEGAKALKSLQRIKVVPLDVTSDESVDAAVEYVKNNLGTDRLWALVNNAGYIEYNNIEFGEKGLGHYERMFAVNIIGVIRVTKSFLPIIRKQRGSRIVMLGSCAGRMTQKTLVGYCCTKYALRSFTDGLRREMKSWGVHVSNIQPMVFATSMGNKELVVNGYKRRIEETSEEIRKEYGEERIESFVECIEALLSIVNPDIGEVVDQVIQAIVAYPDPEAYYKVGKPLEKSLIYLSDILPEEIFDFMAEGPAERRGMQFLKIMRDNFNI